MATKIAVESGNPYRDQSGHFGTSPNQALEASFKALEGKKFFPKGGKDKEGQSNVSLIMDRVKEAKAELAAMRANTPYNLPDPANVRGFDVTKLTANQEAMILRRNVKLNPDQTYGEYYEQAKGQKADIYMLTPNEYRRGLIESGQYKTMSEIAGRTDMDKVDRYAQDMKNGDKFDTPSISYDRNGDTDQEGLHRAYAAQQVGISHIPVAITYSVDKKPEYLDQFENRILDITSLNKDTTQQPEIASTKSPKERLAEIKQEMQQILDIQKRQGGLTDEQAQEVEALSKERADIVFDNHKPVDESKVATGTEAKSTLTPHIVATAVEDRFKNHDIYDAMNLAVTGVYFNADTPIDDIMNGKNDAVSAREFYDTFSDTRTELKKEFGDSMTLYRAEGKQKEKATTNWATTKEFAELFGEDVTVQKHPVDNIIAVNATPNGRYHEMIVGTPPEIGNSKDVAKNWKPSGTEAEAKEFAKDSAFKGTLFHGTTQTAATKIEKGGFDKTKKSKLGDTNFPGTIMLASDQDEAAWYGKRAGGDDGIVRPYSVVSAKINSAKHKKFTSDSWDKFSAGLTPQEAVDKVFKDNESFEISGFGVSTVAVKDPKQVMVFNNDKR